MASASKAAIFTTIANMARQVCTVSEKAAKEGVLGGLDYVLLQSLGYAIAQHVSLIELPPVSTSAVQPLTAPTSTLRASSPPSSPAHVAVDVRTSSKRKPEPLTSSSTSTSSPTTKKKRKEEAALATSSPSPNTSDDEPIKRCRDCGRTKTNQWRSGPEGMSTLCNACGMRYTRRMKRQVGVPALSPNVTRRNSVLDSPLCGHDSDHGLSPVSSPLPFDHHHQLLQHSPMLDDSSPSPNLHHHQQQEKRSNLYNLLN